MTRVIASLGGRLWRAEGSRIELGRVVGSDAIQGPQAESGVAAVNRPAGDARSGHYGKQQNKEKQDDHRTNTLLTLLAARVVANQQAIAAAGVDQTIAAAGVDDGNDVPAVIQSHRAGDVIAHHRCHRGGRIVAAKRTFGRVTRGPSPPRDHPGMGPAIVAT
jgi:hypothetical protein